MVQGSYFLEFLGQHTIEGENFIIVDIILCPGDITDKVGEEFEEGSLIGNIGF